MEVVKAIGLTKIYGEEKSENATTAVNGIDLVVEKGEFIAVMGPSGSGKSTLISMLSGITKPTSGSIIISERNIAKLTADEMALFRRKKLGFVFQDFNLLDHLSVKENIMLPMVLDKRDTSFMNDRVEKLAKLFGVESILEKYPYAISGGQKQRVAVARALVNEPDVVFADEPTGNLDSKSANSVMRCFSKMNEENGATILIVTHDVFAASCCKKVIFIKDGRIHMEVIRKGTRKEFFDHILDCQAIVGGEVNEF